MQFEWRLRTYDRAVGGLCHLDLSIERWRPILHGYRLRISLSVWGRSAGNPVLPSEFGERMQHRLERLGTVGGNLGLIPVFPNLLTSGGTLGASGCIAGSRLTSICLMYKQIT